LQWQKFLSFQQDIRQNFATNECVENFSSKCPDSDAEIWDVEHIKGQGVKGGGGDPTLLKTFERKIPLPVSELFVDELIC
jgi:hypothetical protein